jgi:hypothetical protein
MMFLALFGSLGLAMTIASQGNLRTASTHLHVMRALGAAETGLEVARARLAENASRFLIPPGRIDADYGRRLWNGSLSTAQGLPQVLPPPSGFSEETTPRGIAQALVNQFNADQNIVSVATGLSAAQIATAPAGINTDVYDEDNWITTPAVAIDASATAPGARPAAFSITYAPLANGTDIRIFATGFSSIGTDGSTFVYGQTAEGASRPITRTIWQDFRLAKRHSHLAVTPARMMVGKNVNIAGNVGATYTDVAQDNGTPLLLRSDFRGLDSLLDRILDDFYAGVRSNDADGDNRLRINHPVERTGIPSNATDYNNDGIADNAFTDTTGDGYVDDFDLFINFYDGRNGGQRDGRIALSDALRSGTPSATLRAEFTADDDLALLIDSLSPDRNRNGISGYDDSNSTGRWDSGEVFADIDPVTRAPADVVLGYRDGVIDRRDDYAKVRGRLMFRTTRTAWETARGSVANALAGPVRPSGASRDALQFNAATTAVPDLTASSFQTASTDFANLADGQAFARQVESQRGLAANTVDASGATSAHVETRPTPAPGTANPLTRYFPANMDNTLVRSLTGQNLWERMPFAGPSHVDWYIRPRYENMTFTNVTIPVGNNGLFINCTFVGVTFIQTETDNTHQNWQLYGRLNTNDPNVRPVLVSTALDKSDFLRWTTGNVTDGPSNYASFPDPPRNSSGAFLTGTARDTKLRSNNIRFHNCLFVGTISSAVPQQFTHVRNKLQFTGSTRFVQRHPTQPDNAALNPRSADRDAVSRSSLLVPNYSVDVGHFNAPTDTFAGGPTGQNVQLQGTIVAGLLDIRGNASISGTMLTTFRPVLGQGPLQQYGQAVGNPANFNISLGYFGPADGDREAVDPSTLINGPSGRRMVGWDLDNDGLADTGSVPLSTLTTAQQAVATEVPFYGFGRIDLSINPDLPMPDGIMLPVSVIALRAGYGEGRP